MNDSLSPNYIWLPRSDNIIQPHLREQIEIEHAQERRKGKLVQDRGNTSRDRTGFGSQVFAVSEGWVKVWLVNMSLLVPAGRCRNYTIWQQNSSFCTNL